MENDQLRYENMKYSRCGKSGVDVYENSKEMVLRAFDLGITHFDI